MNRSSYKSIVGMYLDSIKRKVKENGEGGYLSVVHAIDRTIDEVEYYREKSIIENMKNNGFAFKEDGIPC